MKIAIRTLALTLVATGFVAGAYSKKVSTGVQAVESSVPIPSCPLNSGGCGIWK